MRVTDVTILLQFSDTICLSCQTDANIYLEDDEDKKNENKRQKELDMLFISQYKSTAN